MIQLDLNLDTDFLRVDPAFFTDGVENFRCASYRAMVRPLLDGYGLDNMFVFFLGKNDSLGAPYHNLYHSFSMVLNCYEGAKYEKLSYKATRILLAAALFHDFNHSGGHEPDSKNIEKALCGFAAAQAEHGTVNEHEVAEVSRLIQVTQYPFIREPVTVSEMIIRDADLMTAYEEDDAVLLKQYHGLKEEMQIARQTVFSDQQFADGNIEWLNKEVKWYSLWGQAKAVKLDWEAKKKRLHEVLTR